MINGAAAHEASRCDIVILCSYAEYEEAEVDAHRARLVYVNPSTAITQPIPGELAAAS